MDRKSFLKTSSLAGAGFLMKPGGVFAKTNKDFPVVRVAPDKRHFTSKSVEKAIAEFSKNVKNKELAWLFNNCFPNTLDTTVDYTNINGEDDTYVITGDIDAMWLRDSSAQVWPYLQFMNEDAPLKALVAGLINRQTKCILLDPYANAFYKDESKVSEWSKDLTDMKPGVHERKFEVDSLCYPLRLAYHYWKITGDTKIFNDRWEKSVEAILKTFLEQQRKDNRGPYKFQRLTAVATDTVPLGGYGYPVNPVGLICSPFRPSDDAAIYNFLVPSNFFAIISLRHAAEMVSKIRKNEDLAGRLTALAGEVESALKKYAIFNHKQFGDIYAFEVDGYSSFNIMDDSNVPSLLSLPYLEAVGIDDPVYANTRKFVLSSSNPFFFKGKAGEGIGGPHIGVDMIWPMSIVMRAFTTNDDEEIRRCIQMLQNSHGGTGFMHESFHKDDPKNFTRSWFAWTNTLFGELLWKVYKEKPSLLS